MRHFKCKKCGTSYEVGPFDRRKAGNCFNCGEPFKLPKSRIQVLGLSSVVVVALLLVLAAVYFR